MYSFKPNNYCHPKVPCSRETFAGESFMGGSQTAKFMKVFSLEVFHHTVNSLPYIYMTLYYCISVHYRPTSTAEDCSFALYKLCSSDPRTTNISINSCFFISTKYFCAGDFSWGEGVSCSHVQNRWRALENEASQSHNELQGA